MTQAHLIHEELDVEYDNTGSCNVTINGSYIDCAVPNVASGLAFQVAQSSTSNRRLHWTSITIIYNTGRCRCIAKCRATRREKNQTRNKIRRHG